MFRHHLVRGIGLVAAAAVVVTLASCSSSTSGKAAGRPTGDSAAVNQSVTFGPGSGGLQLFNQALTPLNIAGLRADTLTFNVDLSSYTLPVDIYTGTLRLRAQATP